MNTDKKFKVYIASPYTIGNQAKNVRDSIYFADKLIDNGYLPFAPLLSHFWDYLIPHNYDYWLEYCVNWLLECDFVLRLPGESKGADYEEVVAMQNGIPVVYSILELNEIIKGE